MQGVGHKDGRWVHVAPIERVPRNMSEAYGIYLAGFSAAMGLIHDPSCPDQARLVVQHRAVSSAD